MINFFKEKYWFIKKLCSLCGIIGIVGLLFWTAKEIATQEEEANASKSKTT